MLRVEAPARSVYPAEQGASGSPSGGTLAPWVREPYRLWSLLEMQQLFAERIFSALITFAHLRQEVGSKEGGVSRDERKAWAAFLKILHFDFEATGLESAVDQVQRIKTNLLYVDALDRSKLITFLNELEARYKDDLGRMHCVVLSRDEAKLYQEPRKDWESILGRFPSIVDNVEEAYKCYALGRYTAAVFHSLQVMEIGLIDLGKFLRVRDPLSGWTAVSKALDAVIAKDPKKRTLFERRHFAFLEQVQGTVGALKNAWRNKVSHAQGRLAVAPEGVFTPETAEEVLFATRAFMRRLADGLPPAQAKKAKP